MFTKRQAEELTGITILPVRSNNSLLEFDENLIFHRDFRKFTKQFCTSCLVRRDREREKNGYFQRHYKCAAHLQKTCEISGLLTESGADITLLYVRSTQLHTQVI